MLNIILKSYFNYIYSRLQAGIEYFETDKFINLKEDKKKKLQESFNKLNKEFDQLLVILNFLHIEVPSGKFDIDYKINITKIKK
ncbi:MAG: hypothetical protein JW924_00620 [Fusobacteriaceae bacterium]|nr:hypothetical protein [Fusobacteriaceae bacterium]